MFFTTPSDAEAMLEFRVFYECCSAVTHYFTEYHTLDSGPLESFWNNQSHFEFVSKARFPTTPTGEVTF